MRGDGSAELPALAQRATEAFDAFALARGVDALGDDAYAGSVADARRRGDRRVVREARVARDEAAIEFVASKWTPLRCASDWELRKSSIRSSMPARSSCRRFSRLRTLSDNTAFSATSSIRRPARHFGIGQDAHHPRSKARCFELAR